MQAYEVATADSSSPFGDKASTLNELMNEMIQEDCQKGVDSAESDLKRLESSIASNLKRLESPTVSAKKAYDSATLTCDKTRDAMEEARLAFDEFKWNVPEKRTQESFKLLSLGDETEKDETAKLIEELS